MSLPNDKISIPMVASELGTNENDLGRLCTHLNINKWAKYKPVIHPSTGILTAEQLKSTSYGIGSADGTYARPTGGANSPFRLSDFIGYNHDAKPPVGVEIISVNGQTTPPFKIFKDSVIIIEFKLHPGDINPKEMNIETVREKNTNPSGGFGGISWIGEMSESNSTVIEREPERVFGTETLGVIHSQIVKVSYIPRLEYMYYKGDPTKKYETTFYKIIDKSYLDLFQMSSYSDVVSMSARPLFYNISDDVVESMVIINNTAGQINGVRLRARYTINAPDLPPVGQNQDIFVEGAEFDLNGNATTSANLPLQYLQQGYSHTYTVYFYLEKRSASGWDIMTETQIFNETIYIPIPE